MKTLICEVRDTFSQYGYRKERNSFWKKENGFYKLVNTAEAEEFYSAYLAENREMDFSAVDQYLKELLDA